MYVLLLCLEVSRMGAGTVSETLIRFFHVVLLERISSEIFFSSFVLPNFLISSTVYIQCWFALFRMTQYCVSILPYKCCVF